MCNDDDQGEGQSSLQERPVETQCECSVFIKFKFQVFCSPGSALAPGQNSWNNNIREQPRYPGFTRFQLRKCYQFSSENQTKVYWELQLLRGE